MKTKLFTLEEANQLIPKIRKILAALRAHRDREEQLQKAEAVEQLSWLQPDGSVSPKAKQKLSQLEEERQKELAALEQALEEIGRTGAQLKDLDDGLVDFFAQRGEELICLCWKEGEDRIRFWHDLESGFAGRRPVEELE